MQILEQNGVKLPKKVDLTKLCELDYKKNERQHNLMIMYLYLQRFGPATRDIIVDDLNIPRTTVLDYLRRLENMSWVKHYSHRERKAGRPKILYVIQTKLAELQKFFNTIDFLFGYKSENENSNQ